MQYIEVLFDLLDAHTLADSIIKRRRQKGAAPVRLRDPGSKDNTAPSKGPPLGGPRRINVGYIVGDHVQPKALGGKTRGGGIYTAKYAHSNSPISTPD